jgi:hypothetical protein
MRGSVEAYKRSCVKALMGEWVDARTELNSKRENERIDE